jgi:hypothetical protein
MLEQRGWETCRDRKPDDHTRWCHYCLVAALAADVVALLADLDTLTARLAESEKKAAAWDELGQHIDREAIGYNAAQITAVFVENHALRASLAAVEQERDTALSHNDLCRLSQLFNSNPRTYLGNEQDRRINEALKAMIAASQPLTSPPTEAQS